MRRFLSRATQGYALNQYSRHPLFAMLGVGVRATRS